MAAVITVAINGIVSIILLKSLSSSPIKQAVPVTSDLSQNQTKEKENILHYFGLQYATLRLALSHIAHKLIYSSTKYFSSIHPFIRHSLNTYYGPGTGQGTQGPQRDIPVMTDTDRGDDWSPEHSLTSHSLKEGRVFFFSVKKTNRPKNKK